MCENRWVRHQKHGGDRGTEGTREITRPHPDDARKKDKKDEHARARARQRLDVPLTTSKDARALVEDGRCADASRTLEIWPQRDGHSAEWRVLEIVVVAIAREPLHPGCDVRGLVDGAAEDAGRRAHGKRREHDERERQQLEGARTHR
jgi:hypothetical protein